MSLPRVAILGGGVGGVTAAVQLSEGEWQKRFGAITLYQQGWRLGGKGASGRGPGRRIEEHGLHIWFGFYENAFGLLARAHAELDELAAQGVARWPLPFGTIEESFTACDRIALADHDGCCWKVWHTQFGEFGSDRPWIEPDPRPPLQRPDGCTVLFYAARCLELAADLVASLADAPAGASITAGGAAPPPAPRPEDAAAALWAALGSGPQAVLRTASSALDAVADRVAVDPLVEALLDILLTALDVVLGFLRARYDAAVRKHDDLRRACYLVDLLVAVVRGLVEDGVVSAASFDVVNDVDFADWLMTHGARRESVASTIVRTLVYDLPFAYRGGDPQRPAAEAGTALRGLLRVFFTGRGAVMWKMNAAMGEVVFAPLYELLVKRGVEVRFFHRLEALRCTAGRVHELELDVQADPPPGAGPEHFLGLGAYTPPGAGGGPGGWPSDPAAVLGPTGTPASAPETWESWYAARQATRVRTEVLTDGAPDGFDLVVFGLSVACVENVAPDLPAQSTAWQSALARIETVPTQALQLWLRQPTTALGDYEPGVVLGGFTEPHDTWADMHHLVGQEAVPESATVAYFCNAMPDSAAPPRGAADAWLADQQALVRAQALRFLSRDVATLWPAACDPLTREFDWELLVDPTGGTGRARLDWQFSRANVEPSERYVLSVPGSSAARIPPDATGFENLFVAGDWTACGLNAGCVEAATISGMLAANGIFRQIGAPDAVVPIIGERSP